MRATTRTIVFTVLVAASLVACGDDAPPPKRPAWAQHKPGGPARGPAKAKKGKSTPLILYGKVEDQYRRAFSKEDFEADSTGMTNRDPFRSYLVRPSSVVKSTSSSDDECARRLVADKYSLRALKLVGIVMRGTRSYAMFVDSRGFGNIAHRGDCLSKERARIKEIGDDRVVLEIRGDAPPGAPAPAPREEVWKLYPQELELPPSAESGQGD